MSSSPFWPHWQGDLPHRPARRARVSTHRRRCSSQGEHGCQEVWAIEMHRLIARKVRLNQQYQVPLLRCPAAQRSIMQRVSFEMQQLVRHRVSFKVQFMISAEVIINKNYKVPLRRCSALRSIRQRVSVTVQQQIRQRVGYEEQLQSTQRVRSKDPS